MLKLFKHIVLLLIILVVADRIIGSVLEHFLYKQHHGDDYITIQTLDSTTADIIILGSSRASHHYISDSIEQYTGLKTFNGGRDNMGIHYTKAIIAELLKRHRPKYIILDIIPYAYINDNQHNKKYFDVQTSVLLPFANQHKGLYADISAISQEEVWKSKLIKSYAYNSLAGSIFQNTYTHMGHAQIKGYEPLSGKIDTANYHQQLFTFTPVEKGLDTNSFTLLKQSLQLCNEHGVKAVICFSPFYYQYQPEKILVDEFMKIASSYNCSVLNFSADSTFVKNPDLFYDELHLNNEGAGIFSKKIAEEIVAHMKPVIPN